MLSLLVVLLFVEEVGIKLILIDGLSTLLSTLGRFLSNLLLCVGLSHDHFVGDYGSHSNANASRQIDGMFR